MPLSPDKRNVFFSYLFWLVLLVGYVTRIWLSLTTIGTNDVMYWKGFQDIILEHGPVEIYRLVSAFNHPPFLTVYLKLIHAISPFVPNGFFFLIRLPAIISDIGTAIIVYRLANHFWGQKTAQKCAALVALSPVLILVSGFHGNTDPVFIFLVLFAAERLILRQQFLFAGLLLGMSLNIKIVPMVTLPLFFFWIPTSLLRLRFAFGVVGICLAGYLYHLIQTPAAIWANMFQYSSIPGVWGWGFLMKLIWPVEQWPAGLVTVAKLVMASVIIWKSYSLTLKSSARELGELPGGLVLLEGIGWTFLLFLILTPGFGVQYFAWLAAPGIFLGLRMAGLYNLLAGVFLISVYNQWAHGLPWKLANSILITGRVAFAALVIWSFLILWLVVEERKKQL